MSTVLVPKPRSWWVNRTQPDAPLIEVRSVAASDQDVFVVIYKYGPEKHDLTAMPLARFFQTFLERDR